MRKIVLAIDSFKDCLSSREVEDAAEQGVYKALPYCEVIKIPVSDGGEGMLGMISNAMHARFVSLPAHDALMRQISSHYGISADGKTAIIEMADTCGLMLLKEEERNPAITTTFGLGEQIHDALLKGCKHLLIGVGGTATSDGGAGMLRALGYRFYTENNILVEDGGLNLVHIHHIDTSQAFHIPADVRIEVACDVDNPLYGPMGAAFVFAPQKGADTIMVSQLDVALHHWADVLADASGNHNLSTYPGTGAGGGVGAAFISLLNAQLRPGIDLLLDAVSFDKEIEGADLIITGEGKIDRQTLGGKLPLGILKRAMKQQIPVIAIAGRVEDEMMLNQAGFKKVCAINPPDISLVHALNKEYATSRIEQTIYNIL